MTNSIKQTENGEHLIDAVVTERIQAADGVILLSFGAVDGSDMPAWEPGAHLDVHLPDGVIRQYSICGDPADHQVLTIAVQIARSGRGGSKYIHENLHVGTGVTIGGPRNHFKLVNADRYLFIARGIGITPIVAMIREVEKSGKLWTLVYGGRTLDAMAFREELSKFKDRVSILPRDTKGELNLAKELNSPEAGTAIYVCGAESVLLEVEQITEASWPKGALHLERFSPKEIESGANTAFEIELANSGKVIEVAADVRAIDALADAGIHIISSCGEGTCGTCETGVISGEVDHRDSVLTKDEQANNDCMMVCVSRANCARLVLDL